MNYYRIHDKHSAYPDRWYLGSPVSANGDQLDARIFTGAHSADAKPPLHLPIIRQGSAQDFTLAAFDVPVLADTFVDPLRQVAPEEFQEFPVTISGSEDRYSITNVLNVVNCLDESRSAISRWPADTVPADLAGTYLTVSDIHIDPSRVGSLQIFRLGGWLSAIIVSERVGAVLADASGAVLEKV